MAVVPENDEQKAKGTRRKPMKIKEKSFHRKPGFAARKGAGNIPMKSESHKRKRATNDSMCGSDRAESAVMKRAKEVQASLAPKSPSIVKLMLPSHVTGGFWLGLPKQFCEKHLPKKDTMIVLEDESGENYQTKYLVEKIGLSAGWRGFSIAHNLVEGDAVVFHLVKPTKFKVYIVRVEGSEEIDGALGLLKLDACGKQLNPVHIVHAENLSVAKDEMEDQYLDPLVINEQEDSSQKHIVSENATKLELIWDQSEGGTDGIRLSESVVEFKEVKSFEDFDILVNGLVINCELSRHLQTKYYELCGGQRSFLHDHLIEGLNCKLAAGIISETINIADAIRASKLTTSRDHFMTWEKTLKAFQSLGMNVNFLLVRLDQLMNLAAKSQRREECRLERVSAEEEIGALESKLLDVKEIVYRLDRELETIGADAENLELMFRELATAPWG